jgi:hypothetical protein
MVNWTTEDERLFQILSAKRIATKNTDPTFDIKLGSAIGVGEDGERLVEGIKGEVKNCFAVSRRGVSYGKVFVEIISYGRPSGLSSTKADWWSFVLNGPRYRGEVVVSIKTDRLKRLAEQYPDSDPAGQDKASIGKRIPVEDLVKGDV